MTFITVTIWKSKSSKCPWRSAYAVDMKFFTHVVETTFINIKILNCNFEVSMNSSNLEVLHCPFCPLPRWYIIPYILLVWWLCQQRVSWFFKVQTIAAKGRVSENPTLQCTVTWMQEAPKSNGTGMMLVYFLYLLGKKFPLWVDHDGYTQLGKNLVGGCGSNYSFLPRICK